MPLKPIDLAHGLALEPEHVITPPTRVNRHGLRDTLIIGGLGGVAAVAIAIGASDHTVETITRLWNLTPEIAAGGGISTALIVYGIRNLFN